MQKADTEYLSREIASLRIALGEVATRDFVRSELIRLTEELDEAASGAAGWSAKSRKSARQVPAGEGLERTAGRAGRRRGGAGAAQ